MKHNEAIQTAQQLLDSEFENVNHNPADYCRSMGWDEDSKGTKKAIQKKDTLAPTANDIESLASIISSCRKTDSESLASNHTISDFLCNCVAGHILA